MATTTHDAQTAGMMAAMITGSVRKVPAQFDQTERLRLAWLEGYDAMSQALRGCVPAPQDAAKPSRPRRPSVRKAVALKAAKAPAEPQPPKPPMRAILDQLYHQA